MGGATDEEKSRGLSEERQTKLITDWMSWSIRNGASITAHGGPLGKTLKITTKGATEMKNAVTGYIRIQAESHEEAAKLFLDHPHLTLFAGNWIEIMEQIPTPGSMNKV